MQGETLFCREGWLQRKILIYTSASSYQNHAWYSGVLCGAHVLILKQHSMPQLRAKRLRESGLLKTQTLFKSLLKILSLKSAGLGSGEKKINQSKHMTKRNRGGGLKEMSVEQDIGLLVTHKLYRCQEQHPPQTDIAAPSPFCCYL